MTESKRIRRSRHPGRSPAQVAAIDAIGAGNRSPIMAPSTERALRKNGLICKIGERLIGSPPLQVRIAEYELTIPVHIQWCEYWAAQLPEGEEKDAMPEIDARRLAITEEPSE